ncbi:26S proteasome non-ATPase regulatory subunit 10-like [Sitodiplosis mosellana]|uniref:26S proteasome non-ATPase regulatory subunit 10-like n=1 Tax=Sitodiplosis mosellana TaxID=263140 RepID=UPI002444BCC4|nr:26S proteasome non-ATPase regulatory subunit 10-like [Sitodiplosis mosellana]XP_055310889.1 26S proteasome non-ATPase regulatory subunit 10-like [Sitodiplosis mosellana]
MSKQLMVCLVLVAVLGDQFMQTEGGPVTKVKGAITKVNKKDESGRKALHIAALHIAAENGNLADVKKLIEKGADVNATNDFGRTPLHLAAMKGHKVIIDQLLKAGANPKHKDSYGKTAFNIAYEIGNVDVLNTFDRIGVYE